MKNFKKLIKEALTPHYLRESVNEDFTHSSLAITDQSQISGLDDSELLDLLNKVSYEYTPELKDAARIIAQEIEDRNLTNKIHYVYGIRYEFRESVNENLMAKFQDALDDDQFAFFQRALDKADRGEELNQSEEQVVKYFGMVKAKYDDAIAQGMSPDEITLNPNKPINEESLDDRAKRYFIQKVSRGEIDTLPENPKEEFLRQMMKDQMDHDEETLRRERGLEESVKMPSQKDVNDFFSDTFDEIHYLNSKPVEDWDEYDLSNWAAKVRKSGPDYKGFLKPEDLEMTPEEEHEHVKNLLKRNFMDESEDKINELDSLDDPVMAKLRRRQMQDDAEKAKQAELDKKYGKSFMDKLEAEIVLKQQLGDLKSEREQIMIDMEQEAEPEGGEIADRYGSRLNDIDARMELIQKDIDDLRMYESVNENEAPVKVGDKLKMAYQGSTVRDKTGVVTSVSDDMAQVDFGGGDSYGILFSRIKGNEIIKEDLIKEFQRDGGNYRSSYQHRQPEEQLTSTDDYELFMEMFPRGEASRILMDPKRKELYDKHLEWTKEYDNNNTFVHMQYHEVEHEGELYKVHQTQYYNGNYDDFRNPRFTELMISKDGKRMGTYLVDTKEYVEDLKNLDVKKRVSESLNEEFKVGDKVTYLGHPGVITATRKDPIGRDFVDVSYDKGTKKMEVDMILAKSDAVKAVEEGTCGYTPDGEPRSKPAGPVDEESDTDVGGGAKLASGLDIDDEGASDAALDSEVNKMGYAESKEFNFKKMIKEALTPDYLK